MLGILQFDDAKMFFGNIIFCTDIENHMYGLYVNEAKLLFDDAKMCFGNIIFCTDIESHVYGLYVNEAIRHSF